MIAKFQSNGVIKLISESDVEEFALDMWFEENGLNNQCVIIDHDERKKVKSISDKKEQEYLKIIDVMKRENEKLKEDLKPEQKYRYENAINIRSLLQ